MIRILFTPSYKRAVAELYEEFELFRTHDLFDLALQIGAAVERISEEPMIGRSLGSVIHSHRLRTFAFALIYEYTDDVICFLHVGPTPQ